ncbi:FmdB family zinc ribbon protein [Edaphobacter bradus]|uniref:FmdB family zinc ribbon protein n=1 Tax=Edaphobacter bradus TaxID=2259016 RepID=UPI0021E0BA2A|nr:zinc ribbon domain-containing protein [Edaphobacter bradus]
MPLYEYECTECHERTERRQKFSDPEITICPHCNGHLERVLSVPAVSFKGGGWYSDLYSSAKPKAAGDSKSTSPDSASASSAPASSTASSSSSTASSTTTAASSSSK